MTDPILLAFEAKALSAMLADPEGRSVLFSGATASAITLKKRRSYEPRPRCPHCHQEIPEPIRTVYDPRITDCT